MKKLLSLFLTLCVLFSLVACTTDTPDESTPATEHIWGEWEITENPTLTSTGKAERKCTTCSATESKVLEQLELPFEDYFDGGNCLAASCLTNSGMTTDGMLNFCSYEIFHSYIYENGLAPLAEQ